MLNTGHKYGTIIGTVDVLRTHKKRKHLNTLQEYHIYNIRKNNLKINDTNIDTHNSIFRALQEINTRYQHTRPMSYIKTEPTTQKHSEQLHTTHKDKSTHQQNVTSQVQR
jgi:hypothetical protein